MFQGFWKMKFYQDSNEISKNEVASLMSKDAAANNLWQKSKRHTAISWGAVGVEIGFLTWQFINESNNKSQTVPFIGVLASAGVAIGFNISATSLRKKAILKYNDNLDVGTLNLGPTYNGYGLVLSF